MSLIYKRSAYQLNFFLTINDYLTEIVPFAKRIDKKFLFIPLVIFKTIEWCIYRWYKTPIRRFYGIKSNELIYNITNRCNEKCPKCGIWKNPETDDNHLNVIHIIECLRRLHHNLYQITITGGEPLLFKNDLIQIAQEAEELKVLMIVISNGILADKDFLEKYADMGHILVISVDTINRDKWNEFRGNDTFDIVMKNILLAKSILGDNLRIQSVLANETKNEIPDIIEFCKKQNIKHNIQLYQDFGGHWNSINGMEDVDYNTPCEARKNICIYPNGDVVKCFDHLRIPLAKEPIGNIAKDDIIEILCTKRSTEISRIMKTCNFPCKNMSCNKPQKLLYG
jgi:radical SAM protein with 4Fe4S-binding SPASM domain